MVREKKPSSSALALPDAAAFSPDGELFVTVSDREVKVRDTRAGDTIAGWKDIFAASDVSYSCISCCSVRKKHKKDGNNIIVAVGTTSGQVLAIGSTGDRWESTCHTGEVTALHFAKHGRVIYTAGADGAVCELNSYTGESKGTMKASKKPITSLAISHDEKFVAVSSKTTRLFSLTDKKEILKTPSDLGAIQLVSISDDGKFLVSSVDGYKELRVWSCDHESGTTLPGASLSMQNQPKMVECRRSTSYEGGALVLAVSKKGVAYVWHVQNLSQDEVLPTKISLKNSLAKKGRLPIISAKLCDVKEDNGITVRVTYGSPDSLQFKDVELGDTGNDINLTVECDTLAFKNMMPTSQKNFEQDAEGNGRDVQESDLQGKTGLNQQGRAKKRTTSDLDSANETINEENPEYNLDEPTMEEKLASLKLLNNVNERSDIEEPSPSMKPPSADSVNVLLKQALRADDRALLLDCLYNRDEKVIAKSVLLLTPADVVKLLKSFILLIQSRGAVLVCVLPWLQALLSQQASSIVSQESSLLLLNSLYQLINARTSTFKSALQLSSSLDYLFSEIADDEAVEKEEAPPIIYEDKDTDDDEGSEHDAMETDGESEELGDVTDAFAHSDGSEIMSE